MSVSKHASASGHAYDEIKFKDTQISNLSLIKKF